MKRSAILAFFMMLAQGVLPSPSVASGTDLKTGPATMRYVQNGAVRIAYREYGHGPLIIMIHGFPDNQLTFSNQITQLSQSYHVVTPVLRGFPPSSVPAGVDNYQLPVVADDIRALIEHFGGKPVILVGHDWGGAVAQVVAMRFPNLVAGLVTINVPIVADFNTFIAGSQEQQKRSSYSLPYIAYKIGDKVDHAGVVRNIRDPRRRAQVARYLRQNRIDGMLSYYKANYPHPPYSDTVPRGGVFKMPMMIIWGTEDEYFSFHAVDDAQKYVSGPLRVVPVPGAGHWPHQDKPLVVNQALRSWLKDLRY